MRLARKWRDVRGQLIELGTMRLARKWRDVRGQLIELGTMRKAGVRVMFADSYPALH